MIPGTFYNMSVELYSGNTLVEANTVNLTEVLGVDLAVAPININPSLDASTLSLYSFSF